jgi:mannose-6-phosphate isomerase
VRPFVLDPNQLHRFYRGGARIAELRGTEVTDDYAPEDWIGSATPVFGSDRVGLSRLPDGRLLRDAIAADPAAWLGPERAESHGADAGVLVKLLDAGERLPVHLHPTREFARAHLGSRYGKTEAWMIVSAGPGAVVHVGFTRAIEDAELRGWVDAQDRHAMLEALHRLPVRAGDVVYVPAGTPHSIGAGILMVEVQEPSDFSILLEWEGFAIDGPRDGHLGLGFDVALGAVDRSAWSAERVAGARAPRRGDGRAGVEVLLPEEADAYFAAERIRPRPAAVLPPGFSIVVVTHGSGALTCDGTELPLRRGDSVVIPHAAGEGRVEGDLTALRCMPSRAG